MSKPIYWISLRQWAAMLPSQWQQLDEWCAENGMQVGIDVAGWHTDEMLKQIDFQKDYDESRQTAGGPGA